MIIDCGLEPDANAMWKFFGMMETYPDVGGCCGFMGLKPEPTHDDHGQEKDDTDLTNVDPLSKLFNQTFSIQQAQVFEYNFAHMIDKPFEAFTGFIHVLPGAFSAYRWEALKFYEIPENL
jgi:chitin synthase